MIGQRLKMDSAVPSKQWRLSIILIALFSLGGLSINQSFQKQIVKTELVDAASRVSKRAISYQHAVVSFQAGSSSTAFDVNQFKFSNLKYAQFIKVEFDRASEQALFVKKRLATFIQPKITGTSEEDQFQPFRG
jgi:hypothetical protein